MGKRYAFSANRQAATPDYSMAYRSDPGWGAERLADGVVRQVSPSVAGHPNPDRLRRQRDLAGRRPVQGGRHRAIGRTGPGPVSCPRRS